MGKHEAFVVPGMITDTPSIDALSNRGAHCPGDVLSAFRRWDAAGTAHTSDPSSTPD